MSMHQYMPDQAVLADSWTLFCPECSQKMRTHHGDTSPGWEGNTHLRMRLRSQGTDYRGPFLNGQRVTSLSWELYARRNAWK